MFSHRKNGAKPIRAAPRLNSVSTSPALDTQAPRLAAPAQLSVGGPPKSSESSTEQLSLATRFGPSGRRRTAEEAVAAYTVQAEKSTVL